MLSKPAPGGAASRASHLEAAGLDSAVWADFVERVTHSGSASAECEINGLDGTRRAVILLGVALPNHPDGLGSLLVTVHDVSTARGLEASLQEQQGLHRSVQAALDEAMANVEQLRTELQDVTTERHQLRAALDTILAQRQQIASSVAQLKNAFTAALDAASVTRQLLEKGAPK